MTKNEYIHILKEQLKNESYETVCQVLDYYEEMIDDLCEDGLSEEEAIQRLDDISEVVLNIKQEEPVYEMKKMKTSSQIGTWILMIVTFPLWGTLLATLLAILLCLYVVIWCIPLMTGAIGLSGMACFIVGVFGTFSLMSTSLSLGLMQLGIGALAGSVGLLGILLTKLSYAKIKDYSLKMTCFLKKYSLTFCRKVGVVC